ncbi:MAG: lysophospholipid acyltransferase family protein [Saprospiraceae bacterium]
MKYYIIHIILYISKLIIRYLPWVVALKLNALPFVLRYIWRYRYDVIRQNLTNSFGQNLSPKAIKDIHIKYYRVLTDYIKESLFTAAWPLEKIRQKIEFEDGKKWNEYFGNQISTIITASHYGNWEMNMVLFPALVHQKVVAFYKPISSPEIEDIMKKIRSRHGLILYPIEQTIRIMTKFRNENILYIFIGDQTPLNMNGVYWNTFLGQDTPWLTGAEKLAKKYNYPVVYLKQQPSDINKKYYTLSIEMIADAPNRTLDGEITEKYSSILEEEINNKPEYWLWSHQRWKRGNQRNE